MRRQSRAIKGNNCTQFFLGSYSAHVHIRGRMRPRREDLQRNGGLHTHPHYTRRSLWGGARLRSVCMHTQERVDKNLEKGLRRNSADLCRGVVESDQSTDSLFEDFDTGFQRNDPPDGLTACPPSHIVDHDNHTP